MNIEYIMLWDCLWVWPHITQWINNEIGVKPSRIFQKIAQTKDCGWWNVVDMLSLSLTCRDPVWPRWHALFSILGTTRNYLRRPVPPLFAPPFHKCQVGWQIFLCFERGKLELKCTTSLQSAIQVCTRGHVLAISVAHNGLFLNANCKSMILGKGLHGLDDGVPTNPYFFCLK